MYFFRSLFKVYKFRRTRQELIFNYNLFFPPFSSTFNIYQIFFSYNIDLQFFMNNFANNSYLYFIIYNNFFTTEYVKRKEKTWIVIFFLIFYIVNSSIGNYFFFPDIGKNPSSLSLLLLIFLHSVDFFNNSNFYLSAMNSFSVTKNWFFQKENKFFFHKWKFVLRKKSKFS